MYIEAGIVVDIWARNRRASGRVARALVLVNVIPTRAQDANRREVPVMSIA
jgi:hypothetical protein